MPTLNRESRALLAFVLATVVLVRGWESLAFVVFAVLPQQSVQGQAGAVIAALTALLLSVLLGLFALSAARSEGPRDVWAALATVSAWVSALLVLLALFALIGSLNDAWPTYRVLR